MLFFLSEVLRQGGLKNALYSKATECYSHRLGGFEQISKVMGVSCMQISREKYLHQECKQFWALSEPFHAPGSSSLNAIVLSFQDFNKLAINERCPDH